MALDSLPDELIGMICAFCGMPEIQSLRSTCRTIRKVADEYLLPEVVLFMNRDSLTACNGLTAHPVISKTVKSLWIQADRLKEMTFRDWDENRNIQVGLEYRVKAGEVVQRREGQLLRASGEEMRALAEEVRTLAKKIQERDEPKMSDIELWSYYANAARLAYESEQMLVDRSLLRTLKDILQRCPKIEAVDLTHGGLLRNGTTQRNKAFQRGLFIPRSHFDGINHDACFDVMVYLVIAASAVGVRPRRLRLGGLSSRILAREDIKDWMHEFFQDLKHLEWKPCRHFYADDNTDDNEYEDEYEAMQISFYNDAFLNLIKAANCLELLHLDLSVSGSIPLPRLVGNVVWPHLSSIGLCSFRTSQGELTHFLLRHRSTLTSVSLDHVRLTNGEWPDCFASIAGKLPKVVEIELRMSFTEDSNGEDEFYWFGDNRGGTKYGKTISKYIIEGGSECPPRPDVLEGPEDLPMPDMTE